ncbi:MAG: hypothetical protein SVX43_17605 [Cyanobacteriota bacterium]|nr:hypothetical protein [Cyanobacteriota bacterium]
MTNTDRLFVVGIADVRKFVKSENWTAMPTLLLKKNARRYADSCGIALN